MALVSALSVVVMFYLLRYLFQSDRIGLALSLLYGLGTPVFFRTGTLNQNLMLGIIAFMGFVFMWNPTKSQKWSIEFRFFIGGLAGGTALLFDYSGLVFLLGLFAYGVIKTWRRTSFRRALQLGAWYILGTIGPIGLLWLYQWRSFGNPFFPGQHWMPPVEWIDLGYQGFGLPQLELFLMLGFDYRFGLFVSSPLMLLALAAPFFNRGKNQRIPGLELYTILLLFLVLWIFFSGSNYVRLQFNTGIRYLTPILPFLFVPVALMIVRFPKIVIALIAVFSITQAWAMAMYREVESKWGILDPLLKTFLGGFQLPALRTLSRMGDQFGEFFTGGISPLHIFVLTAAILYIIWSPSLMKRNY